MDRILLADRVLQRTEFTSYHVSMAKTGSAFFVGVKLDSNDWSLVLASALHGTGTSFHLCRSLIGVSSMALFEFPLPFLFFFVIGQV